MLKNQCSVNLLENFFIISAPVLTVICQSLSFTLSLSLWHISPIVFLSLSIHWLAAARVCIFDSLRSSIIILFRFRFGVFPLRFSVSYPHCLSVWPDLAKFRHFGKKIKSLANFGRFISYIGKNPEHSCDIIGLNFLVANGQILKTNRTIWSHCCLCPSGMSLSVCEAFNFFCQNSRIH